MQASWKVVVFSHWEFFIRSTPEAFENKPLCITQVCLGQIYPTQHKLGRFHKYLRLPMFHALFGSFQRQPIDLNTNICHVIPSITLLWKCPHLTWLVVRYKMKYLMDVSSQSGLCIDSVKMYKQNYNLIQTNFDNKCLNNIALIIHVYKIFLYILR